MYIKYTRVRTSVSRLKRRKRLGLFPKLAAEAHVNRCIYMYICICIYIYIAYARPHLALQIKESQKVGAVSQARGRGTCEHVRHEGRAGVGTGAELMPLSSGG